MIEFMPKIPDVDTLDKDQLLELQQQIQTQIEAMDAREPKDPESEEYEAWGDAHEELEDILDDVLDRLETMA